MSKKEEMQRFARYYREQEGRDVTMQEVAQAAALKGWPLPKPKEPIEILAKEFAQAEREEMFFDEVLGESYNANICYQVQSSGKQLMFWSDIDKANRDKIVKNAALHRDQMVGEAVQATINLMHWNRLHPDEKPVQMELDFGPDVKWRLNQPKKRRA